jgi:hypothetical protein
MVLWRLRLCPLRFYLAYASNDGARTWRPWKCLFERGPQST